MVVIHIKYGHAPQGRQVVGGNGRIVQIAEPAKGVVLGMVSGRADQRVRGPASFGHGGGCGQGTVRGPARSAPGIGVQRRKGVYAVVPRPYGQFARGLGLVADGKNIRVHRLVHGNPQADLLDVVDVGRIVNVPDVLVRKALGRYLLEQIGLEQLVADASHAYGRFHVAALADVVNVVPVVDHQGDTLIRADHATGKNLGHGLGIHGRTQRNRSVLDGIDHQVHVFRRTDPAVLAFQNGPYNTPCAPSGKRTPGIERIVYEVRRAIPARLQRRFIGGPHNGTGTIAFVKAQPRLVFAQNLRIRAKLRIVRKTFVKKSRSPDIPGLLPHTLVQHAAQPAGWSCPWARTENPDSRSADRENASATRTPAPCRGHRPQQHRPEAAGQRIAQQPRQGFNLLATQKVELLP